jgi:hypothetical protein
MNQYSFCLITPSYAPDFERCQLLCESVQQFVSPAVKHYIIVDRSDVALFKRLRSPHTEIIPKEAILPWWIKKLFLPQYNLWLSFKTLPMRGWLIQQIVKLAIAQHIQEDVLIFVDSDVAFIRPFELESLIVEGKVRCYRELNSIPLDMSEGHYDWYQKACRLLNLPLVTFPASDYISQMVTWRRENVLKLQGAIENCSGKSWIEACGNLWNISEYVLYGIFVDYVLGEQSGHYFDDRHLCHHYWLQQEMSKEQFQAFLAKMQPYQSAVMISAKANMSVSQYRDLLRIPTQSNSTDPDTCFNL